MAGGERVIVGAGLAGMIAAHVFPTMPVVERNLYPATPHRALLRFRSPAVGEVTGIGFNPVTVRKGIWLDGDWVEPNIRAANLYSRKVLGVLADRSIWNTDSVTRWIAPPNFYEQLLEQVGHRIHWGTHADFSTGEPVVNTAPLPVVLDEIGISYKQSFRRAPITVHKFAIPNADVYQTVYFPSPDHTLYRASITGNVLICEFSGELDGEWWEELSAAFALDNVLSNPLESGEQRYGKIADIDDSWRKAMIARLTQEYNIFSVGRYATWRNILLDDVVHDVTVVKRLMNQSTYERKLRSL